ncbi:hypothetical protein P168DRAFT_177725 [Aspergillus campestris IBT 28561]|uniref:MOSC domain-containing protein n=1 Tax=Aspergillus campestris (strain IBT 28561) TaxID=1392248 RepID=A0A2I1CZS0_ASPC2|nr:uncharacterized protein P168DRAFT_177725 [Aspergillus campestris IBT 28561]PKY03127.1 hypothetical protein P168DRAFT_177725 [Aspergillus campestris IBT 28561]
MAPILVAILLALPAGYFLFPRLRQWIKNYLPLGKPSLPPPTEIVSLRIYPVKSCRGIQVQQTQLLAQGLDLDRRWMLVDATTLEFLTIRQIPEMTLINTALSPDSSTLILSIAGPSTTTPIEIPTRPDQPWLDANTTLATGVKIWGSLTDGYLYSADLTAPFSSFLGRPVRLVYKGPTPRIAQGNGAPHLLGRSQPVNFPDVHPVLIASESSLADLNARLAEPIPIERFRPNIVVRGGVPWSEDVWKLVRLVGSGDSTSTPTNSSGGLEIDIVARCARCQVPNVDADSAQKHPAQPWNTLVSYRRVDEGIKWKPCFGMLGAPREEGVVKVGMRLEVLALGEHKYIKGF